MSKAFDSINHSILLRKLKAIGLASSAISWLNSYLSVRSQVVRSNAALSDALHVTCGVPQGSVLRALLFSIYVNDLPAASEVSSTACYVDDTKLILSFTELTNLTLPKVISPQIYNESVIGALRTTLLFSHEPH